MSAIKLRFDGEPYRQLVALMRDANDSSEEASRKLGVLSAKFKHSRGSLDREATIAELLGDSPSVSPATRFALALWIQGKIALKRGRKPLGTPAPVAGSRRESLDPELCLRVLLDFGSTSKPAELHREVRQQLADLLTGARKLKRGQRLAPASSMRTAIAAAEAKIDIERGASGRAAIKRAAGKLGIKTNTLQRALYPRAK